MTGSYIAKVFLVTLILTFVSGGIGLAYQWFGHKHDARQYLQRGQSFRVGSISLNLNCVGEGSSTVVLDSGLGGTSLDWISIQPQLAKFTRSCSYDRAGYGWSDPSTAPRTSLQIAKELKQLLNAARERGPYVLVGHRLEAITFGCSIRSTRRMSSAWS